MTPQEMAKTAAEAMNAGTKMTMVVPRPWRNRPPKFPRGELLCEQPTSNVYSYDPVKILAWLAANGFVKVEGRVSA